MTEKNAARLEQWHDIVFNRNLSALEEILAPDVEFHSPFMWKPKNTRLEAVAILSTVIEVFENFTYHRELTPDHRWALEFSANVGEKSLKGIDLIEFNDKGQISRFEVFIRPMNGLMALGEAMGRRLAEKGYI
ncbi:MAG: hypothetical protein CSA22_09515 [Deltaproteobacteria bacterium]|nr:MAG: hypothetical protein CSA22_09515 [Deltaproteobacteria bacterium]